MSSSSYVYLLGVPYNAEAKDQFGSISKLFPCFIERLCDEEVYVSRDYEVYL